MVFTRARVLAIALALLTGLLSPSEAAVVRACAEAGGNVRILKPNSRFVAGMDAATLSRFLDGEQVKDASMIGLSCVDVDSATLPAREGVDAQGDAMPLRAAWRLVAGAVQANTADAPPNWPKVMERLKAVIPPVRRAVLSDFIAALKQAVEDRDVAFFQALYDKLKAAQATATPPLTAAQFEAVKATITEKRIPIVL